MPAKQTKKVGRGNTAGVHQDWEQVLVIGQERGSTTWHSQGRSFQVLFSLMSSAAGGPVSEWRGVLQWWLGVSGGTKFSHNGGLSFSYQIDVH